jgi:predicted AAA+ superfamily ATPase
MNIEELLPDTGKLTAIHAADVAMQKPVLIKELLNIAFKDKQPVSLRAANTIEKIDSKMPELIRPYYSKIINSLPKFNTDGVKRCLLKIFTRHTDLKEDLLCKLIDLCFSYMISPSEPIAIKAYSLQILYSISNKEKDLKNELIFAVRDQMEKNSGSFRAVGNKILKKLYKETSCFMH